MVDFAAATRPLEGENQFRVSSCPTAGVLEPTKPWQWWRREATERYNREAAKRRQPALAALTFRDLLDDTADDSTAGAFQPTAHTHRTRPPTPHTHRTRPPTPSEQVIYEYLKSGTNARSVHNSSSDNVQRLDWSLLDFIAASSSHQNARDDRTSSTKNVSIDKPERVLPGSKESGPVFQYPWEKLASVNKRRVSVRDLVAVPQNDDNFKLIPLLPENPSALKPDSVSTSDDRVKGGSSRRVISQSTADQLQPGDDIGVYKNDTSAVDRSFRRSSRDLQWRATLTKEIKRSTSPCEPGKEPVSAPLRWPRTSSQAFSDSWVAATMVYYANMQYLAHCGTTHGVTLVSYGLTVCSECRCGSEG